MNSAVLITYDKDDIIKEALALCDSAGYKVDHIIKQDFLQKPKFGISGGKIQELKDITATAKPDAIIFDEMLNQAKIII